MIYPSVQNPERFVSAYLYQIAKSILGYPLNYFNIIPVDIECYVRVGLNGKRQYKDRKYRFLTDVNRTGYKGKKQLMENKAGKKNNRQK